MPQPLVSLIIPIYNLADYLPQCLDSVRKQTYENLEALLINDGSTDASLAVCREYSRRDSRFQLIDKAGCLLYTSDAADEYITV